MGRAVAPAAAAGVTAEPAEATTAETKQHALVAAFMAGGHQELDLRDIEDPHTLLETLVDNDATTGRSLMTRQIGSAEHDDESEDDEVNSTFSEVEVRVAVAEPPPAAATEWAPPVATVRQVAPHIAPTLLHWASTTDAAVARRLEPALASAPTGLYVFRSDDHTGAQVVSVVTHLPDGSTPTVTHGVHDSIHLAALRFFVLGVECIYRGPMLIEGHTIGNVVDSAHNTGRASPEYSSSSDESDSGGAEAPQAAAPVAPAEVPMGTPVLGRTVALDSLSATSPLADFRDHVANSPVPAVRAVSLRTGGSDCRSRVHILDAIVAATHGLTQPATPTSTTAMPRLISPDSPDMDVAGPPPTLRDANWEGRTAFVHALTDLYRLAWLDDHNSLVPNMDSTAGLHSKRNSFTHRETSREFGRGYQAKAALYTRIHLAGSGDFAEARLVHPPRGSKRKLDAYAKVQLLASNMLGMMNYAEGDEDAAIWRLCEVLVDDFHTAQSRAKEHPLEAVHVPIYSDIAGPLLLQPGRATAARGILGFARTLGVALLTVAVGMFLVGTTSSNPPLAISDPHTLLDAGTWHIARLTPMLIHALLCTTPDLLRRQPPSQANSTRAAANISPRAHHALLSGVLILLRLAYLIGRTASVIYSTAKRFTTLTAVAITATYSAASGDTTATLATLRCVLLAPFPRHLVLWFSLVLTLIHLRWQPATECRKREAHTRRKWARTGTGPTSTCSRPISPTHGTSSSPCSRPISSAHGTRATRVRRSTRVTGRACMSASRCPVDVISHDTAPVIHTKINVQQYRMQRALKSTLIGTILSLVMDSGCTYHCHPHQTDLVNFRPRRERMVGIDGSACSVTGIGDLPILAKDKAGNTHRLLIRDVRCVPDFTDTLLSVEQFWSSHKIEVRFAGYRHVHLPASSDGPETYYPFVHDEGLYLWRVIGTLRVQGNGTLSQVGRALNVKDTAPTEEPMDHDQELTHASKIDQVHGAKSHSHIGALSGDAAVDALHRRLHIGQDLIKKLPDITADAPDNLRHGRSHSCAACVEANATRLPHKNARYKPSRVGRVVHADIVGPFKRSMVGGFQYMLVLVDDHSRFISVHFLCKKSEALSEIRSFTARMKALSPANASEGTTHTVGSLHTDNAGEFLSHEFNEFLDKELINRTTCPPHVHSLNGVAERAIRAVVENMRSTMVAGDIPTSFWNYVATHSADVLNRTGGPPGNATTSYELVTGEKPKVMEIWPLGCRAFPVKPRSAISKTNLDSHAWPGVNLGRAPDIPNAHYVWITRLHRVAVTSDVWFDETLMPWRPKGEQRVGPPPPHHAEHVDQPPGLPPAPTATKPPIAAPATMGEAYAQATSPTASARSSRTVLLLFSGPKRRPDGLATFLDRLGYDTVLVDNDPITGGGQREDLLDDSVYESMLRRAKAGEFIAIIAAPPCSSFSISRFIKAKGGTVGPSPLRTRSSIVGLDGVTGAAATQLRDTNVLVRRMCAIILAGHIVGTQYIVENPSDRGDPSQPDIYLHEDHGPLWLMPAVVALARVTEAHSATFPMCAFHSPWQKFTTLLYSAGFETWLSTLSSLRCHHRSHESMAGGEKDEHGWNSARAAAYPADFNFFLSRSIAALGDARLQPEAPIAEHQQDGPGRGATKAAPEPPAAPATTKRPAPPPNVQQDTPSSPARVLDFSDAASPASPDKPPPVAPKPRVKKTYERGAGRQATRSTAPDLAVARSGVNAISMALMVCGSAWHGAHTFHSALLAASPSTGDAAPAVPADPRNRKHAMAQDREGWTASELDEIANHMSNGSWEYMDRSEFERTARGRKLVKTVWVYKVKRSGKLKSRLCVQGCSQIPGVDYDQTHCGTMRGPTLRLLSSVAAGLNLQTRRWDFVAAYLQGELLDGEVVYCLPPPGHETLGADGRPQILKVVKPIYGMAQAGRRWQRSLYPWMEAWANDGATFTRLHSDSNVFLCRHQVPTPSGPRDEVLIVGVYVDDCYILYSHDDQHSLYRRFTADLQSRWKVDDEGPVSDLLGVDISESDGILELKQETYIERMAKTWFPDGVPSFIQSNSVPADKDLPQLVADALVCTDARSAADVKAFQSLVGGLLYASTNTRPDIAYAVGMLCRVMSKPTPELHAAALRVLGYLVRTKHLGLRYQASRRPAHGMSDSDWAVKHSTSGWVFLYNSAAVSWGSKKQTSVALSSCEAEIMAASLSAQEAVHLRGFLQELGVADDAPLSVGVDNTAARDIAYNPEHHNKVKHIERRHFYVRECVEDHKITVPYVNTLDNLADFFTKPLDGKQFFKMRDIIMNVKDSPTGSARLARLRRFALGG